MNVSSTNISWFEVANFLATFFIYINSYKICSNGLIKQTIKQAFTSSNQGRVDFIINFTSSYTCSSFVKSPWDGNATFSFNYSNKSHLDYCEGYLMYATNNSSGWATNECFLTFEGY